MGIAEINVMGERRWRERMLREKGLPPRMLARLAAVAASVGLTHPGAPSTSVTSTQTQPRAAVSDDMTRKRLMLLRAAL